MIRISAIVCLCFTVGAIGCNPRAEAPARQASVPKAAIWAGGVDGGSFIECDVDTAHNVNRCLAYNDHTGDVEGGGFYQLSGERRAARRDELRYAFFDGDEIHLSRGGVLAPVAPLKPSNIAPSAMFANGLFIDCAPSSGDLHCTIHRPDGGEYFRGIFHAESAADVSGGYKFFDLSDRSIHLVGGGALVSK